MTTTDDAVAQFEPDFDGSWDDARPAESAADAADDPQWVVWPDAEDESAWAATELAVAPRVARPVR